MGEQSNLTFEENGETRTLELGSDTVRIGRSVENDLVFDNPYLSRFHAEIFPDGSRILVRDLGSTSGTFVNGELIKQRRLKNGDSIRLGRARGVEFVFHSDQPRDTAGGTDELRPMRVITPDETVFINTGKLPRTGDLGDQTIERLRALYEFTSEALTAGSCEQLSERLAAFVNQVIKAERCAVLLWDNDTRTLKLSSVYGNNRSISPSRVVTDLAYNDNVAVLSLDASADARFADGDSVRFGSIRSVMCAPIGSKSRLWGVCYVDNVKTELAFDDEALDFLSAIARQAGLAMENLYLFEEQRRSLESFISTLAASLDARDDNTAGHSARVGVIACGIAKEMDLSEAEVRLIYYAGLLHDYGKIGIRDDVLLKPAELTDEEYAHIKEHPQHTYRLLSKIRFPEDLADVPMVAASHHERWDGTGYPRGLKGEQIPLGSRIVSVADAYDAITKERCYSEPMSPDDALVQLTMRSGSYFDPEVIVAFANHYEKEIAPRSRRLNERTMENEPVVDSQEE